MYVASIYAGERYAYRRLKKKQLGTWYKRDEKSDAARNKIVYRIAWLTSKGNAILDWPLSLIGLKG